MTNESVLRDNPKSSKLTFDAGLKITGPGQMMNQLADSFPAMKTDDILYVWLDEADCAIGMDQVLVQNEGSSGPRLAAPAREANFEKLIVICRASSKNQASEMASDLDLTEHSPLDILLVADGRWWSKLCTNTECCPVEGRELASRMKVDSQSLTLRHEVWLKWLNLVNEVYSKGELENIAIESEEFFRKSLDDLAIRDCVLNNLAVTPDLQSAWNEIFQGFLAGNQTYNNQVLYCLLAAIYFSNDDLSKADFFTKQALLIDPRYSLALLMQHGLEIKMDCKKVVAAFTHYTADELLRNTPAKK